MNNYSWNDLSVGLSHGFEATVTEEMMRRFKEQTGDVNPLHIDAAYARGRDFEGPVVYGLLTSSFFSTLVGVHLPGRNALLQGLNVTFRKPVYVGMQLYVSGEVVFLSEAYRRIEIAGSITANGEQMSKAKILVGLFVRDVILVTGASSALGRALLTRLSQNDCMIYAHYANSREALETHIHGLAGPAKLVPIGADFRSLSDVEAMITTIRAEHGQPNKLVHLCAQPLTLQRFAKLNWNDMDTDWHVSVRSISRLSSAFLPELAKAGAGGRVVFALSSVTLGVPPKGMAAYTTVKYALLGLMRALAAEYAEAGIRINAVSPYTMETAFLARVPHKYAEIAASQNPARRNATPEDVVPAIEFFLSDASGFTTGANFPVTAGAGF